MTAIENHYIFSIGNTDTYVYKIGESADLQEDRITGRSSKTVIAFRDDMRLFSGLALSSSCPYEGRIAYDFIDALASNETFLQIGKEKYNSTELLSYYINYQIRRFSPIPKEIYVVVPKWWNEKRRSALSTAAKIAQVKIRPIPSDLASAYSYYNRFSDIGQRILCTINCGATGIEMTYSQLEKGRIQTLQYNYFDIGGEDLTIALANQLFQDFLNDETLEPGATELITQIKQGKKVSQKRQFYNKANQVKEDLKNNTKIKFNPTFSVPIERSIDYKYFTNIEDIQKYKKFLVDAFSAARDRFNSTYENPEIKSIEVIGGTALSQFIEDIVKEVFPRSQYNVTNYLNKKEAIVEGAAYYAADRQRGKKVEHVDAVECFIFSVSKQCLVERPVDDVIVPFTGKRSEGQIFSRSISTFSETKVYELSSSSINLAHPDFDEFHMIKIDGKLIKRALLSPSTEELAQYEKKFAHLQQMDDDTLKLGELRNELQSMIMKVKSYYIAKVLQADKRYEGAVSDAKRIADKYESDYKKRCEEMSVKDLTAAIAALQNEITDNEDKLFDSILGKRAELKMPKQNCSEEELAKFSDQINVFSDRLRNALQLSLNTIEVCEKHNLVDAERIRQKNDKLTRELDESRNQLNYLKNVHISKPEKCDIVLARLENAMKPLSAEQINQLIQAPRVNIDDMIAQFNANYGPKKASTGLPGIKSAGQPVKKSTQTPSSAIYDPDPDFWGYPSHPGPRKK